MLDDVFYNTLERTTITKVANEAFTREFKAFYFKNTSIK